MFSQFIKYNLVGIANTLVGFGIILFLMSRGISPILSNAIGYVIGAFLSYYLNSRYTFYFKNKSLKHAMKFFIVLLLAYGLNLMTLYYLLSSVNPYLAQSGAALVYTLSAFIFMKLLVFRDIKERELS